MWSVEVSQFTQNDLHQLKTLSGDLSPRVRKLCLDIGNKRIEQNS